jgi:hypothetical protein
MQQRWGRPDVCATARPAIVRTSRSGDLAEHSARALAERLASGDRLVLTQAPGTR